VADILMGVCRALVGNYLAALTRGKKLLPPIVFQGATALNKAFVRCFEDALGWPIAVPDMCSFMGAIGIAKMSAESSNGHSSFRGFDQIINASYQTGISTCPDCENRCELLSLYLKDDLIGCTGSRCGKREI